MPRVGREPSMPPARTHVAVLKRSAVAVEAQVSGAVQRGRPQRLVRRHAALVEHPQLPAGGQALELPMGAVLQSLRSGQCSIDGRAPHARCTLPVFARGTSEKSPEGAFKRVEMAVAVEDHGASLLRHANGMIGTIVASTIARPGFPARLELHAERGSVVLENDDVTTWAVEGMENPSTKPKGAIHSGASVAVTDTAGHEGSSRTLSQPCETTAILLLPASRRDWPPS